MMETESVTEMQFCCNYNTWRGHRSGRALVKGNFDYLSALMYHTNGRTSIENVRQ